MFPKTFPAHCARAWEEAFEGDGSAVLMVESRTEGQKASARPRRVNITHFLPDNRTLPQPTLTLRQQPARSGCQRACSPSGGGCLSGARETNPEPSGNRHKKSESVQNIVAARRVSGHPEPPPRINFVFRTPEGLLSLSGSWGPENPRRPLSGAPTASQRAFRAEATRPFLRRLPATSSGPLGRSFGC